MAAAVALRALARRRGARQAGGGVVSRVGVARAVKRGVERVKARFDRTVGAGSSAVADHLAQRMHLEVLRLGAIGHQVKFTHAFRHGHAVQPLAEQVDDGYAVQQHMLDAHQLFQRRVAAREQQHDLDLGAFHAAQHLGQAGDAGKLKTLGEGEVFLHQPKARKPGGGGGQQRLGVGKAHRLDGAGGQGAHSTSSARHITWRAHRLHQNAHRLAQTAFVQLPGHVARTTKMQHQVIERELVEGETGGGAQAHAQTPSNVACARVARQRQIGCVGEILHPRDFNWPQPQRAGGAEFTVGVLAHGLARPQATAARQRGAYRQASVVEFGRAGGHRHRGRGSQKMRVNGVEQVPGEARVLGIELEADARRQEGGGLNQAFDIGIGNLLTFHAQPLRDFGISPGELPRAFAKVAQLLLVEGQQSRVHGAVFARGW